MKLVKAEELVIMSNIADYKQELQANNHTTLKEISDKISEKKVDINNSKLITQNINIHHQKKYRELY